MQTLRRCIILGNMVTGNRNRMMDGQAGEILPSAGFLCLLQWYTQEGLKTLLEFRVLQVIDVLESQARSALLPDAAISAILDQLNVDITYEPLKCQAVALSLMETGHVA
ncbi:hypothetical protein KIN20_020541 [Parelaphostrongylus tenuis]|uniref:Uncharacterized protein n=1 Tax=Parelaphostrongylus tenuis TaxID=148309 RepID=A0AAD5N6P1_PARTN|nr:hypothetical protein KIN20_020541 [Parelaphostrongylus tenuis]